MKTEEKIQELEKQIEELEKEEEMEQWFKSLLNGLEIEINDDHPKSVFYKKNGNIFFELYQDSEKRYFWCNHDLVWSIFYNKYKLNYDETEAFVKNMIEQYLKLVGVIPTSGDWSPSTDLSTRLRTLAEQYLKLVGVTPFV